MVLAEKVLAGDRLALARAITLVENLDPRGERLLREVYARTGRADRIGVTGPPGAGKSTLVSALTSALRARGRRVGIIAVDPTSPFTGGALLGDRIRMLSVGMDEGVFIRSMATRGSLGGLAVTSQEVCDVLDAAGQDVVLIETVGVGQSEVEVAAAADTTLVVLTPETGDTVQAMKSGLMEIADLIVVNKADRPGSERIVHEIQGALDLRKHLTAWTPRVLKTVATTGDGVTDLLEAMGEHRAFCEAGGLRAEHRKQRVVERIRHTVERHLERRIWGTRRSNGIVERLAEKVIRHEETPYSAAERIVSEMIGADAEDGAGE
jgi:LAO/AO transport system kinase